MSKKLKRFGFLSLAFCIIFVCASFAGGQDLGSSSDLFRPKPKKETAPKKAAPKKKSPPPVRRSSSSSSSSKKAARRTEPRTAAGSGGGSTQSPPSRIKKISLSSLRKTKPDDDIIITIGKKTSGNFEEMFEEAIIEGNLARNLRDYTKAENAYSRAKKIKPNDSRAIYGLGNLYSDQQRWEEAEVAYRQAIELEPDDPNAYVALSFVLTQPAVGTNPGLRYAEAEKLARKAIELNPENPFAHDQLGVARELQGIISGETENSYRQAIRLDPTFALAYAHLGRLLRVRGSTRESNAAYRKAVELSEDVPTMILVAEVLQSQQRFLESEQLLRGALKIDPKHPTALFLLGRALTTRGSFAEAETVLMKSVEVSPNSFVSYALLGSVYSRQQNWSRAEQTLNKALSVVTANERKRLAQEFEAVGDGFMKNKKFAEAGRIYKRAISLDEEKVSLKVKLAEAERN